MTQLSFVRLPPQLTSFIGRDDEILRIAQQLDNPNCHLLTLVGPGGIGKTRLAIEVAAKKANAFADGIYFVDLQPINTIDSLVTTIANSMDMRFFGEQPPRVQLLNFLRDRKFLLLIDNFEHLLDGVDLLSEIVKAAPNVKLLVTSREALNVQEEWLWQVNGLQFPENEAVESIENFSALRLFTERACRVRPDFKLNNQKNQVIRICRLVEGMPLALELAASWTKALSCDEIANEIQHGLEFLKTSVRNVPERHRSMQAIFDHSWKMLTDMERDVFPKLSVFRGGFRREAAEVVAGASLQMLLELVDKSFLRMNHSGRYTLHELMRQHGESELLKLGKFDLLSAVHSTYYAKFLHAREQGLKGHDRLRVCEEIEADFENIRTAWIWAIQKRDYLVVQQALFSLDHFCYEGGRVQEGVDLFAYAVERLAPQPNEEPHRVWGRLLCRFTDRLEDPITPVKFSLEIARKYNDKETMSEALFLIGWFNVMLYGDYTTARDNYEKSIALIRERNDSYTMAILQAYLAHCYDRIGQLDAAVNLFHQTILLSRKVGNSYSEVLSFLWLGDIMCAVGRYSESEHCYDECSAIISRIGNLVEYISFCLALSWLSFLKGDFVNAEVQAKEARANIVKIGERAFEGHNMGLFAVLAAMKENYAQCEWYCEQSRNGLAKHYLVTRDFGLSLAACGLGDLDVAEERVRNSLQYTLDHRHTGYTLMYLPLAAYILANRGEKKHAIELLGLAFNQLLSPVGWMEQCPLFTHIRRQLETEFGTQAYLSAWEHGSSLDFEIVAGELCHRLGKANSNLSQLLPNSLTERELEVLRLMADGLKNREIAERLFIVVGTVKAHVNAIYHKLDVNSRVQAVKRAQELKIL